VTKSIIEQHPELNGRGVAREVSIKLPRGLHSRPSARLAQLAQNFEAAISIISENGEADAKSMLDVLSLAIPVNSVAIILAKGADADMAVEEISAFLSKARE
jgi:Phosphotransferase System HPr (HPr) Family